ncbi:MAG: IPT/TIG domain-containing protein, partial [Bacteroidota bacterium]
MKKYFLLTIMLLLSYQDSRAFFLLQSGNGKIIIERTFVVKDASGSADVIASTPTVPMTIKTGGNIVEQDLREGIGLANQSERGERDRESFQKTAAVNLTYYTPTGWSFPIVVSNTYTSTVNSAVDVSTIFNTDSVYINYAALNNGTDPSPSGVTLYGYLYVDNVLKFQGTYSSSIPSNNGVVWINKPIGKFAAGSHSFRLEIDPTNVVIESNENDNSYQRFKSFSPSTTPSISSFTPSVGSVGTSVTINGSNFGATQGAGGVQFGTTSAGISSWSNTQIIATVPSLAAGNYTITVLTGNGNVSSSTQFAVLSSTSTLDPLPSLYRVTLSSAITTSKINYFTEKFGAVWIAGNNGLVAKSSTTITAGSPITWTRMSSGISTTEHVYALEFASATLGFAGTGTGKIYRTTDGGTSWLPVFNNTSVTDFINYIKFDNSTTGIAIGDGISSSSNLAFLRTTDGGVTWLNNNTYLFGTTTPSQVHFITSSLGFMAGNLTSGSSTIRGIFKTTNYGNTWNFYPVAKTAFDSTVSTSGVVFLNSAQGLAVKNDSTLWKTSNGGVTWTKVGQLPHWGYGVTYLNSSTALVVGSHGMVAQINLSTNVIYSMTADVNSFLETPLYSTSPAGIFINVYNQNGTFYTTFNPSVPLTTPSILNPSNGSQLLNTSVTLSWSSVTGATSYDLEVGTIISSSIRGQIITSVLSAITIPDLAPGTTYQWRVRARSLTNSSSWSPLSTFITPVQQTVLNVVSASYPAEPKKSTDYRLVTIPVASPILVGDLFKGNIPNDYRIYSDNGGTPPNHLNEMSSSSTMRYGQGYWLIKKNSFVIDGSYQFPAPTNGIVSITMNSFAWNIIGSPYSAPVKWSDVITANNLPPNSLIYAYEGESGFIPSEVMKPFIGYYYFSNSNTLSIPFPFSSSSSDVKQEPNLKFTLEYSSSMNKDQTTFFGTDPSAQPGIDQFEVRKPPLFSDQGSIWFDRPEWDSRHSRFASDIRPSLETGQTWNFILRHTLKEPAHLKINNVDQLPGEYTVVVLNTATGVMTQFDRKGNADISVTTDETPLSLIVGKANYIRSKTDAYIPSRFELYQNFPNPFNPSSTIRFGIPEEALVKITMYDLLGRKISTLVHDVRSAGVHECIFDGSSFASGTYVYSLKATSLQSGK